MIVPSTTNMQRAGLAGTLLITSTVLETAFVGFADQGLGVDEALPFSGGATEAFSPRPARSLYGDENLFPFDQFHRFERFQRPCVTRARIIGLA
jgi:hypothetical protein